MVNISFDDLLEIVSDDKVLSCPHCGYSHDLTDCENLQYIVSYWGEEPHNFCCSGCDKDFLVKEIVTRKFETAKTIDELHA